MEAATAKTNSTGMHIVIAIFYRVMRWSHKNNTFIAWLGGQWSTRGDNNMTMALARVKEGHKHDPLNRRRRVDEDGAHIP